MPLPDDRWRAAVETVLGVRREQCEAWVAAIAARHPAGERRRALARSSVPRALFTGAPSGWTDSLPKALGLALIEELAIVRQRATLLSALGLLDDPRFFERDDWPKRALGLAPDEGAGTFVLREGARVAIRFAIVRGAHAATRWMGRRVSSAVGAVTGAAFDALEQVAFNAHALASHTAPRTHSERTARVIPLRRIPSRTRATTEESS